MRNHTDYNIKTPKMISSDACLFDGYHILRVLWIDIQTGSRYSKWRIVQLYCSILNSFEAEFVHFEGQKINSFMQKYSMLLSEILIMSCHSVTKMSVVAASNISQWTLDSEYYLTLIEEFSTHMMISTFQMLTSQFSIVLSTHSTMKLMEYLIRL